MDKEEFEQAKQTILSMLNIIFLDVDGRYVFRDTPEGQILALCLETFFNIKRDKLAFLLPDGTIIDTENKPNVE